LNRHQRPSQISKLSDREGSFVQTFLQTLSRKIYRDVTLTSKLNNFVEPIWERLPIRLEGVDADLPDPATLNYFRVEETWIKKRVDTLRLVIRSLETVRDGGDPHKTVSTRYTAGLSSIPSGNLQQLLSELSSYSEAIEEAALQSASCAPVTTLGQKFRADES
jgi:hypothetical protein